MSYIIYTKYISVVPSQAQIVVKDIETKKHFKTDFRKLDQSSNRSRSVSKWQSTSSKLKIPKNKTIKFQNERQDVG